MGLARVSRIVAPFRNGGRKDERAELKKRCVKFVQGYLNFSTSDEVLERFRKKVLSIYFFLK